MSKRHQKVDAKSVEGFPSHTWGPGLWKFIHLAALGVRLKPTEAEVHGYIRFFKGLGHVMPCGVCRREYRRLIGPKGPLTIRRELFENRRTAFEWSVKLHDAVSLRLGHKRVDQSKNWGEEYEKLRYAREYKDWTNSLGYKNYLNPLKQRAEAEDIRSFVMTSNPVILYISPVKWAGARYDRDRAKRKWEDFSKTLGNKIRFGIVPVAKYKSVFSNDNRIQPGRYVLYKDGILQGVAVSSMNAALRAKNTM